MALLLGVTLAGAGLHAHQGATWPALAATLSFAVSASWGTHLWSLSRQAAAERRARLAEEAAWWSGPLPPSIDGGDGDTVAFGCTVVPIATRRSGPGPGAQKAG
ncbi:hypothetical protein TPA0907_56150 [Micromonospora humidisoli]|nr:hypothetical protein TPA0907_56150 [Micromonospora sp. AKA109]